MEDRKLFGSLGERFAEDILFAEGWHVLERNFRAAGGEIDLICERDQELSFVEVKTRSRLSDIPADGLEAVDGRKQSRIRRAALCYVERNAPTQQILSFQVIEIRVTQIADAF